MDVIAKGIDQRRANIENNLGVLAYQRLTLMREMEEIDKQIAAYEAMADENTQAKKDLETKLAQAKEKRDVAARKLDELKEASADRWEKVKEGVENAIDDLKTMFE